MRSLRGNPLTLLLTVCAMPWLWHCTSAAYLGKAPLDADPNPSQASAAGAFVVQEPASSTPDASRSQPSETGTDGSSTPGAPSPDAAVPAPDASVTPTDAGAPAAALAGNVCVPQPSFEGSPAAILFGFTQVLNPWMGCFTLLDGSLAAPLIVNQTTLVDTGDGRGSVPNVLPAAADGSTYLYLDMANTKGQTISVQLCEPLRAGRSYGFAVEVASRVGQIDKGVTLAPGRLSVYAQGDGCSISDPPLWQSPPLSAAWKRYCVSMTATSDVTFLSMRLSDDAGRAAIMIDGIRADPTCITP